MTPELHHVFEQAKKLSIEQRRGLADLILKDIAHPETESPEIREAVAIVEETSGSMAGLDRETLIKLAEDGY